MFSCNNEEKKETERPPNVVIVFTDDQGYQDLSCFGSPNIHTPNLDQMAKEGIRLTSYYSAQAVCSASRAGLLTGCYPNRIGISGAFSVTRPVPSFSIGAFNPGRLETKSGVW